MADKDLIYTQLNKFVGRWNTEGKIIATGASPEILITGTDTYEWLSGNFFLIHKVDVMVGEEKNETLEIIGIDHLTNSLSMQHYDNKGNSGFMTGTYHDGLWIFLGNDLKFTGGFKQEDNEFSGIWEELVDGADWKHFMDIRLTRVI